MASKAVFAVLGTFLIAALSVGVLVGTQLDDGSGGDAIVGGGENGSTEASGPSATETARPADQRTTVPARSFDEREIAKQVAALVNDERESAGLPALTTNDNTATEVRAMARAHSVAMADAANLSREIDGVSTRNRYKNAELFETCMYKTERDNIAQPGPHHEFEAIGQTVAGQSYQAGGETRFNGDERAVARTVVTQWMGSPNEEPLLASGISRLGVGVEVTSSGTVYATAAICA